MQLRRSSQIRTIQKWSYKAVGPIDHMCQYAVPTAHSQVRNIKILSVNMIFSSIGLYVECPLLLFTTCENRFLENPILSRVLRCENEKCAVNHSTWFLCAVQFCAGTKSEKSNGGNCVLENKEQRNRKTHFSAADNGCDSFSPLLTVVLFYRSG